MASANEMKRNLSKRVKQFITILYFPLISNLHQDLLALKFQQDLFLDQHVVDYFHHGYLKQEFNKYIDYSIYIILLNVFCDEFFASKSSNIFQDIRSLIGMFDWSPCE